MNGHAHDRPGQDPPSQRQGRDGPPTRRIPTVEEALPYSPFTSIVPFDPAIIPVPNVAPPSHGLPSTSKGQHPQTTALVEHLNREATIPASTSKIFAQVYEDVKQLTNAHLLPDFKFPNHDIPARGTSNAPGLNQPNGHAHSTPYKSRLGAFAIKVMDSANVPFRYPTPVSPARTPVINGYRHSPNEPIETSLEVDTQSQPGSLVQPNLKGASTGSSAPPLPAEARTNGNDSAARQIRAVVVDKSPRKQMIHDSQGSQESGRSLPDTPVKPVVKHKTIPQLDPSKPLAVSVPQLPQSSDPLNYVRHPEVDAQIEAQIAKKRKREASEDGRGDLDFRAQGEAHVDTLHGLMMNIFDVEDRIQSDASAATQADVQVVFSTHDGELGASAILTNETLDGIDNALLKVTKSGRMSDIAIEPLCHLQRLCVASVARCLETELSIVQETSEEALRQWTHQVSICHNSLKASKTMLRMMTAGWDEKQLYSDENVHGILQNIQRILENCILPLAVKKSGIPHRDVLDTASDALDTLQLVTTQFTRIIKFLGQLLMYVDLSESSVNLIEHLSLKLVFAECALTDNESLLGLQRLAAARRNAMDTVAQIFLRYPDRRQAIFDEVLSSLEKLPVSRQSARQFRITGRKPIQLVSALIMQLIQTSSMNLESAIKPDGCTADEDSINDSDSDGSSDTTSPKVRLSRSEQPVSKISHGSNVDCISLDDLSTPLYKSGASNAAYVVRYLVGRAQKSTKGGDEPYRVLLDIFTEDFLNVLGSTSWPAAVLVLEALLSNLFSILNNDKSLVPAKNMALDLMGSIGCAVAELRSHIARVLDGSEALTEVWGDQAAQLFEDTLSGVGDMSELLRLGGAYQLCLEGLESASDNAQKHSAVKLHIVNWAYKVSSAVGGHQSEDGILQKCSTRLSEILRDPRTTFDGGAAQATSEHSSRTSYALILLSAPLGKAYSRILNSLINALTSPQATLRSRALKSVPDLLEKDPSILDHSPVVLSQILRCTQDPSPMVRDSALGLVGKCSVLQSSVEGRACKCFIDRSSDAAVGVRKRAIRLLREMYSRNKNREIRAAIVGAILARLKDAEDSIIELARQTIEELWLTPFHTFTTSGNLPMSSKKELEQHAFLIVATAQRGVEVSMMLETLLRNSMSSSAKHASVNFDVCKTIVSLLLDCIIDNDQTSGRPSQTDSLHGLATLAKANPLLFNAEQMLSLRPYLENLETTEDLQVYRSTVIIFRRVLPVLPPVQRDFLLAIQDVLFKSVSKLNKAELGEAAMCLWIINGVVGNPERLVKLMRSLLKGCEALHGKDLSGGQDAARALRLSLLVGHFGKVCDLEPQRAEFEEDFPSKKFGKMKNLIIDAVLPFANQQQPTVVQESALEAINLVCQSWPKGFMKSAVRSVLFGALTGEDLRLRYAALFGLKEFYLIEDARSKAEEQSSSASNAKEQRANLGQSMIVTDKDSAAAEVANHFLPHIKRLALASTDDIAIMAAEIVISISRQRLFHPKETVVTLIALATSPIPETASAAISELRDVHAKNGSLLDGKYLESVDTVITYEQDTKGDKLDLVGSSPPRLTPLFEVLQSGSPPSRKKLIAGLCSRAIQDLTVIKNIATCRFITVNLGLIDYIRIDEIIILLSSVDSILNTKGNLLIQELEVLFKDQKDAPHSDTIDAENSAVIQQPIVDEARLQQLTVGVVMLDMLRETRSHVKRAWGLQSLRTGKDKPTAKDATKAPVRATNVSDMEFLGKLARLTIPQHRDAMIVQCQEFIEQMSFDNEAKTNTDEDQDAPDRQATPSEHGTDGSGTRASAPPSSQKGKRKRVSTSVASTPTKSGKPRNRPAGLARRRSSKAAMKDNDDDDDADAGWD